MPSAFAKPVDRVALKAMTKLGVVVDGVLRPQIRPLDIAHKTHLAVFSVSAFNCISDILSYTHGR